jgi:hypothetical protein
LAGNGTRKGWGELVVRIAAGSTIKDAAVAAGIGERTAHRHAATPAFQEAVNEARSEYVTRALGRLSAAAPLAVNTLLDLLKSAERESTQLGAARILLDQFVRLRESEDLASRVAAIEAQLNAAGR